MEFPYGHNPSHTHHRRNDDRENQERPPSPPRQPPYYQPNEFAPPPPHHQPPPHYQQTGFDGPSPPPPSSYFQQPVYPPPSSHVTHLHHSGGTHQPEYGSHNYPTPPGAHVTHVAHESGHQRVDPEIEGHHSFRPSFPHHQPHSGSLPEFSNKPSVKVFCRANPNFHLTIRDGKVVLAPANPSDVFQHWYKDEKYSTRVKDEVGFPSFALVNKGTGQAIKHSIGASHPVQLVPYRSDQLDESMLWSESKEVSDGYRAIRMINNIRLNMDAAFNGDKKHGGVHDGTIILLWEWNKGENQQWKIVPYCKFLGKLISRTTEILDTN